MNKPPQPPKTFMEIARRYPDLVAAHEQMSSAAEQAGPLDARACALVRIGLSVGAGLDSALRSHVRRGRAAGLSEAEIEQAIMLGMTTLGFPRTIAAYSQAQVQFERDRGTSARPQNPQAETAVPEQAPAPRPTAASSQPSPPENLEDKP